MSLYESLIRPIAFRLDPERVHEIGIHAIAKGMVRTRPYDDPVLRQSLFGQDFSHPLGLAAGFDKNAVAVDHWHQLGFSFVEIGTVTRHAQPGNPKPRLFRYPSDKAIINRMGFNNDGSEAVEKRLSNSHPKTIVGINLGKSKITPLEDAAGDYQESFRRLLPYGSYFVVNVSSPNTPGLRSLQDKGPLTEILQAIREVDSNKPLFVKVAPDLDLSALDDVIDVAHQNRLTGLIATNTTIARDMLTVDPNQVGGLSGRPVYAKSNQSLKHLADHLDPAMTLIGVGGIFTGDDLYEKIRLGADLCQLYTGFIYGGPSSVPTILRSFSERLIREGITDLAMLRQRNGR